VGLGYTLEMFKMLSFPGDIDILLHLNLKTIVRGSILTSVLIGRGVACTGVRPAAPG
jgi:hypothetical protein